VFIVIIMHPAQRLPSGHIHCTPIAGVIQPRYGIVVIRVGFGEYEAVAVTNRNGEADVSSIIDAGR
jgi:hypothetical protein